MAQANILVIDDQADIREMMQFDLRDAGYQVTTAADGIVGLAKFGTGAGWDLVLLDQRMPKMDGMEVLKRLRELDPTARIIMVTANASVEMAAQAFRYGAVDFFRKPFSFGTLRGVVKAALAGSGMPSRKEEDQARPFFNLNGFGFRPVPLPASEEETEALRVRRAFEVQAASGEIRCCAVEVALYVRQTVRAAIGRDPAPAHPVWSAICENALANHLWEKAEFAPDTLTLYDLTARQMQTIREWKD